LNRETVNEDRFDHLAFDFSKAELPRFVAVEGNIGVGKTTLAKRLARTFNYDILLEKAEENPFLERFYLDRKNHALPTQLFFLFQRTRQFQELRQGDMFEPVRVADFLIDKDPLFARVTLDDDELSLYNKVYEQLTIDAPRPDLVVYLQAPVDVLLQRIRQRGQTAEQAIDRHYLNQLNEAYTQLFHYYTASPLLIVNATAIDLVNNPQDYKQLVEYMLTIKSGRHYYNPL
jgi:deoxyadenosine/deoxycytidine kinase